MKDSICTGEFSIATPDQIEAARKLAVIGWPWNHETVQGGVVRLYNQVTNDLPGRHRLGETILIAEIEPNGAVKMGDRCDGFSAREAAAKRRARRA